MLDLKSLVPWSHKKNNGHSVPATSERQADPYLALRHDMEELFDRFTRGLSGALPDLGPKGAESWFSAQPVVDVEDGEEELLVTAELPGVDEKDVHVLLEDDILTIRGEKKYDHEEKDKNRHYIERRYGSFERQIRLPFHTSDENITAKFDKGVLTLEIPKPAGAQEKVKEIPIST